jgi:hypothetical protein
METLLFPILKSAFLLANLKAVGNLADRPGGNFEVFFDPLKFP